MKFLVRSPISLRRLPVVWMVACGAATLSAQDRLIFKDNHFQDGKIAGMNGNTVLMDVATSSGRGQMGFDLGLISRVEAPAPPAFQTGAAAYAAGQWDRALTAWKPLVDQYHGLPTDWARQATGELGDVYVEKNDLLRAESAYNDFRRFYPGGSGNMLRAGLGAARIAMAKNNAVLARQQLDPITQAALKNPCEVAPLEGAAYGQAFYLSGQLHEQEGNFQAALEDYLRTVTLFYQDAETTARG